MTLLITLHCFPLPSLFLTVVSVSALLSLVFLRVLPLRLFFPCPSVSPYFAIISLRFFCLSAFRLACCSCRLALAAAFSSSILRSSFAEGPSTSPLSLSSKPKPLLTDDNLLGRSFSYWIHLFCSAPYPRMSGMNSWRKITSKIQIMHSTSKDHAVRSQESGTMNKMRMIW